MQSLSTERPDQQARLDALKRELDAIRQERERRLAEIEQEKLARKARRSFVEFVKQAWHVLEPGTELEWGPHIEAICLHLEAVFRGEVGRLLINVPPGHMKSLLVNVFWPAWVWLHRPGWRVLFATYAQDLTERDSVKCRDLIRSQWYQETFKPTWQIKSDQNSKDFFENTEHGFRISLSVTGKGTGYRGDCIVADDPISVEESFSEAARKRVIRWWDKTMSSRLNDQRKGARVVIMHRLHAQDLAGHLIKKGGYEHLKLPSEFNPKKRAITYAKKFDPATGETKKVELWKDHRTEEGEPLFPALYPKEVLAQAKIDMGPDGFAGQHQQEPMAPEGGMFKLAYWRWYRPDGSGSYGTAPRPDGCSDLPAIPLPAVDFYLGSLDANFKEGDDNSFVVFTIWGVRGAERFLVDLARGQIGFQDTLAEFRRLKAKWPQVLSWLVEEAANGSAIINTLKTEIPGILPVKPEGGKEARAAAVSPQMAAGQVYLPEGAPWVAEYVLELAGFPKGDFNDQVDSTSQALLWLWANPDIANAMAMSKE